MQTDKDNDGMLQHCSSVINKCPSSRHQLYELTAAAKKFSPLLSLQHLGALTSTCKLLLLREHR